MTCYLPWDRDMLKRLESLKYIDEIFKDASDRKICKKERLEKFRDDLMLIRYVAHCAMVGVEGAEDIIRKTKLHADVPASRIDLWETYKTGVFDLHHIIGNFGVQKAYIESLRGETELLRIFNENIKAKLRVLRKQVDKHVESMSTDYVASCTHFASMLLNEHANMLHTARISMMYYDMHRILSNALFAEYNTWSTTVIRPRGRTMDRVIRRSWWSTSPSDRHS